MSNTPPHIIEIMNDLILVNNDRMKGYEQAQHHVTEPNGDLLELFSRMAAESVEYTGRLRAAIEQLGGEPVTGTSTPGKIYLAWAALNAVFTGNDRFTLLGACVHAEEAAQTAYADALHEDLPLHVSVFINEQKSALRHSFDTILGLWNEQKLLNKYVGTHYSII